MSDRPDLPRIKPFYQPTIFNKEMANDALGGNVIGWLVSGVVAFTSKRFQWVSKESQIIGVIGAAIGAIHGGIRGKKRLEHEHIYGKTVQDPSYFNSEAATGLTLGFLVDELVDNPVRVGLSIPAKLGLWLAPTVIGSIMGKQRMDHEFNQAVALKQQQHAMAHPPVPHIHTVVVPAHASTSIDGATASKEGTVSLSAAKEASV